MFVEQRFYDYGGDPPIQGKHVMQEAFRALIDTYCGTLARQLEEIGSHLDDARSGSGDRRHALAGALDLSHQIAGLSGTMGFSDIGTAAAQLEALLMKANKGPGPSSPDDIRLISDLFETLNQTACDVKPEQSTLYNVDFSHLAKGFG